MIKKIACLLMFCALIMKSAAQSNVTIKGSIVDAGSGNPLVGATINFDGTRDKSLFADANGNFAVSLAKGEKYVMTVSYVGYNKYVKKVAFAHDDSSVKVAMKSNLRLSEVVVTAKEGGGLVSSSVIGRDAMNQLQPNSIADLMELLPGGYAKDPNMGAANTMTLRETGTMNAYGESSRNNDYSISSLGTQFIVDGAPISTDANLQYSPLSDTQSSTSGSLAEDYRNITNKGVDMRTVSTDDIEKVEVVRGIPSAEHGNLTSGIVNIKKIRRAMPLTVRFKADGYNKLFSMGKGLALAKDNSRILNLDLSYLDSKIDPTDNLENYKRVTASLRYTRRQIKGQYNWNWNAGFDYSGSFDDSKSDPDLNYGRIDEYKSSYNRMALTNSFVFRWPKNIFKELEINTSVSLQLDRLKEKVLVAPQRYGIVPTGWDDGENEANAVYAEYVADYLCDGKPFNAYAKIKGLFGFDILNVKNNVKVGLNWDYSKNYGDGQVYDMYRPLSINGWTSRPRRYKDIPGLQNFSTFAEETFTANIGANKLEGMVGVRTNTMLGLDKRFDISNKVYLDPRINVSWQFPYITMANKPLKITLSGGWGLTTKNPTLNYLYPDMYYSNFIEMAYYDTKNPEQDSRFVVMSYKQAPTNYDIQPARNRKWEVRLDMEWNENTLSVDYFRESMSSGFRYSAIYDNYSYKSYDVSKMSAGTDWRTLPYTDKLVLDGYQQASNGSRLVKEGIELQFNSCRIRPLRTRINISGAWFRSTYTNSQPMFEAVSTVVDNQVVSEKYVGLYAWNDGRVNDRLNTNFTFDTQIPEWGFVFTTSVQCMWLIKTTSQEKNGYPIAYISADDGQVHPFTKADETNVYLMHLVKTYNAAQFDPFTVPMAMTVNLKATKQVGRYMKISFFANKILDYLPDYTSNGNVIRRNADPYFGVEANLTL